MIEIDKLTAERDALQEALMLEREASRSRAQQIAAMTATMQALRDRLIDVELQLVDQMALRIAHSCFDDLLERSQSAEVASDGAESSTSNDNKENQQ